MNKFLVDAQLPRQLCPFLALHGCNALHTRELLLQNRTSDQEICKIADRDERIVVSKDADFVNSHLLNGVPKKLLLVATFHRDQSPRNDHSWVGSDAFEMPGLAPAKKAHFHID